MDGRLNLFSDVKRAIEAQVPDVQHVDLYNENVEYVDEESPWQRPAVFIEIGDIGWKMMAGKEPMQRGEGEMRLHNVTDWMEGGLEKAPKALVGIDSQTVTVYYPETTMTCRSHGELMENIEIMKVRYLRKI